MKKEHRPLCRAPSQPALPCRPGSSEAADQTSRHLDEAVIDFAPGLHAGVGGTERSGHQRVRRFRQRHQRPGHAVQRPTRGTRRHARRPRRRGGRHRHLGAGAVADEISRLAAPMPALMLRPTTMVRYRDCVRNDLTPAFGTLGLDQLAHWHISPSSPASSPPDEAEPPSTAAWPPSPAPSATPSANTPSAARHQGPDRDRLIAAATPLPGVGRSGPGRRGRG